MLFQRLVKESIGDTTLHHITQRRTKFYGYEFWRRARETAHELFHGLESRKALPYT